MFFTRKIKLILGSAAMLLSGMTAYGQEVGGNAYIIGDFVEVAIDGPRGKEGTADWPGHHSRGGSFSVPYGFVANPAEDGWVEYDGDFFTPGTPENGFGLEIDGVGYSNNYNVFEIPEDPTAPITHTVEGSCITVEWQGIVAGVTCNVKYHHFNGDLFYTTEVTLINNSGADLTDIYYYRNVDPDNNQPIGGTFTTTNTIVTQPSGTCQKSLVSAEQTSPHPSYLGFGALGPDFRVSHGGFSNRDASDIWDGAAGLEGTEGAVATADAAISLAYKTDIVDGDSVNFTFAIVLDEDAVEDAFASLYYIDYSTIGVEGGGVISQCNPTVDTVQSCAGNVVTLTVDGPNAGDYSWEWTSDPVDDDLVDEPTVEVAPLVTTTYEVVGTPISECLTSSVSKTIVVEFSEGPQISITDPGPQCEEFDITTLEFEDLNDTEDPNIQFLTEMPTTAGQTEPAFVGPLMGPDDEVWLLIGDTAGVCFDAVQIIIDFGGIGAAGDDSTIALCGTAGTVVDLHDLISEGANPLGDFVEVTSSGQFNPGTGELNVGGLAGTYEFTYIVEGVAPCPDDDATFIVEVYPQPTADFEYEVDGVSSADGLGSTCIINEIDFINETVIPGGGTITDYDWNFGDGSTSTLENPSHTYGSIGTFTITLTVTTDEGCTSTYTQEIIIYTEPVLDIIFNDPTCNGFTDGSITAFVAGGSGTFDIEIKDAAGTVLNVEGSNTANTLGAGTYTIDVADGSGCTASATVTLTDPPVLEAFYRVVNPLCYGDSGYIVVDSVSGQGINNPMSFFWAPNTIGQSGLGADSLYGPAQDYVLTINDSKGCSNVLTIPITQPDSMYFTKEGTGYDPAYCRLYGYQSGNGQVYASASGGTPDYSTPHWTYLEDGTTADQGTWGGRNPGDYLVQITDANGCMIERIITVDSLNPEASFTVNSAQLNADLKGTAPVDVEFTNTSLYFANPLNPTADTTFFWSLYNQQDWTISHDINEKFDTTYEATGQSYIVEVCLVAMNKNGCTDTACVDIEIFEPITFTNVNIFTPNGDGNNDIFTFKDYAASISEFTCVIVNRWGIKVGEITDINAGWDGTDMNGSPCQDGVYFYTYEALTDDGSTLQGQGNVQIVASKN